MSMSGPGSIEYGYKKGINFAPPKDAGGNDIDSDFLDRLSDQLNPGIHIYGLVDKWEADPNTQDRAKMNDLKDKLLSAKASHPRARKDPGTIDAIDQLVTRIDVMLGTPLPPRPPETGIPKEILAKARNQFEEFLLTNGFDPDKIALTDIPTLKEKRAFALTVLLRGVRSMDWPNMEAPSPNAVEYSSANYPTPLSGIKLIETASSNIPLGPEKDATEKYLGKLGEGKLRTDVAIIDEFFDLFKLIKKAGEKGSAQQSPQEMVTIYNKLRTLNVFDKGRIGAWADMPALFKEDMRTPEALSLGTLFFKAFKEILIQGREWETDQDDPTWKRSKRRKKKVQVPDPRKRNLRAYENVEHGTPLEVSVESVDKPPVRNGDRSLFPEQDAGGSADVKSRALSALRYIISEAATLGNPLIVDANTGVGTQDILRVIAGRQDYKTSLSADVATILAYHLAVITGESEFQDSVGNRPVGKNVAARLYQAFLYAQKTNSELGSESKTNLFICGRVVTYIRTFLKFAATKDGRTLEQAILKANSWADLDVSNWPDSMTQRWSDHITQGYGEYIRGESGLPHGLLFKLAELNFAEGRVVINQEIMKDLHDMLRFSWEYYVSRDQTPNAVHEDWDKEEVKFTKQAGGAARTRFDQPIDPTAKPPSEEFTLITVTDSDGNILYEDGGKPFITRMPKTLLVTPGRLGEWIMADKSVKDTGGEGSKGKGYDPYNNGVGVVTHLVRDARGRFTGQRYTEMVIKLKPGANTSEIVKDANGADKLRYHNTPSMLARRLLIEYTLSLIAMPGDTVSKLNKEDIIPLGIFLSKEMRENYLKGDYAGFIQPASAAVGEVVHKMIGGLGEVVSEFLLREDPGIYGLPILSQEQYFELLSRMGWKISAHDFQHAFAAGKALFIGGAASTTSSGKHK